MPRPNNDRVRVSFHISRTGKAAVEERAADLGQDKAEVYRDLLRIGLQHAPKVKKPPNSRRGSDG